MKFHEITCPEISLPDFKPTIEPTGGAHRCCTRLALAVGESTLVTKRVAKNDCEFELSALLSECQFF
jgi:hypothetical protein